MFKLARLQAAIEDAAFLARGELGYRKAEAALLVGLAGMEADGAQAFRAVAERAEQSLALELSSGARSHECRVKRLRTYLVSRGAELPAQGGGSRSAIAEVARSSATFSVRFALLSLEHNMELLVALHRVALEALRDPDARSLVERNLDEARHMHAWLGALT